MLYPLSYGAKKRARFSTSDSRPAADFHQPDPLSQTLRLTESGIDPRLVENQDA